MSTVRSDLGEWAMRLQTGFSRLPGARPSRVGATAAPSRSRGSYCRQMVDALETLRHDLLPAPSPPIGLAFVTYVDALLDLYRQCPASRGRAVELHDRANSVGRVFEDLVNAALSGSTWPN